MSLIVINQNNVVANSGNSQYTYPFPSTAVLNNHELCVQSCSIYYAWLNISSLLQNNTFSYTWTVGTTVTTYTITIPDGLYELVDLNNLMQFEMIKNGTYLINDLLKNVYYAEFIVSPTSYKFQINTFPVPTSLPSGWTVPVSNVAAGYAAYPGYPTQTRNPVVTISSTGFGNIMGFNSGFATAPNIGVGTNLSYLSTKTPQVQPSPSALIGCSIVSNKYASPSSIIYNIVPNVPLAGLIDSKPNENTWIDISKGNYNNITIQFLSSTTFSPLQLLDSNLSVLLLIREKSIKNEVTTFSKMLR
jgi:hypothetical protein